MHCILLFKAHCSYSIHLGILSVTLKNFTKSPRFHVEFVSTGLASEETPHDSKEDLPSVVEHVVEDKNTFEPESREGELEGKGSLELLTATITAYLGGRQKECRRLLSRLGGVTNNVYNNSVLSYCQQV